MKKLFIFCLISIPVFAADITIIVSPKLSIEKHNKIAVFFEEEKSKYNQADQGDVSAFFSSVEAEFMRLGFNVIDRNHINKILAEHQFSQSGIVSSDNAIEAGKILGTNAIVVLKYSGRSSVAFSAQMRMVDIETAAVLITANFSGGGVSDSRHSIVNIISVASRKTPADVAKLFFEQIKEQLKK
ncbi:MAG: hypothetical protein A2W19_02560 [Spirochaetes bacterium RBG_16_49_21]|nr:MAG: hypothetical protein A2W19_02560 [Spirochaetes bacterium RBG_16_49_21]